MLNKSRQYIENAVTTKKYYIVKSGNSEITDHTTAYISEEEFNEQWREPDQSCEYNSVSNRQKKLYAILFGNANKRTLCELIADSFIHDTAEKKQVVLSQQTQSNLGVFDEDKIGIRFNPTVETISKINFSPINDSHLIHIPNLKETVLIPYLRNPNGSKLLHVGDVFSIPGKDISFIVNEVVSIKNKIYGIFDKSTKVTLEDDPVPRPEKEVCYADIGGLKKQLPQIREVIELTLNDPTIFEMYGVKKPKGILMYGPPGTGKTYIARAVANEMGAHFLNLCGPEIMGKTYGESEENLRRAFEACQRKPKSILFIDEIDSIAPKRDKTHGEVERRIVAQLLTLMDGASPSSNMVVIGATNRPNAIDPALRRPGRFDREIARETHGYVGADLAALCCEAAMSRILKVMKKNKGRSISVKDRKLMPQVEEDDFLAALRKTSASGLRDVAIETPDVSWKDIGGLENVKQELRETIMHPIKYPDLYTQFGLNASRGVLFYGPPGCGKTLMAKAIAKECGANFISVKGPELLTMWFGESEANIRELFDKARSAAPCIIFFDEIDSIAKKRGSSDSGAGAASDRIVNQLLTEMDGVGIKKQIFIIAATNRPGDVDPALTRPGRLDQLVFIPLPDEKTRLEILKSNLRRKFKSTLKDEEGEESAYNTKTNEKVEYVVEDDVDLEYIAQITIGFSGADLSEICQRACKNVINECIQEMEEEEERKQQEETSYNKPPTTVEYQSVTPAPKKAMKYAHRSVSDDEARSYELFAFDEQKQSSAIKNFQFPEKPSEAPYHDHLGPSTSSERFEDTVNLQSSKEKNIQGSNESSDDDEPLYG